MRSYWFGDVDENGCHPADGDTAARVQRLHTLKTTMDGFVLPGWEDAVACGVCSDRATYISTLRELCFAAAEQQIREQYAGKDTELLQMVRTLDEMDEVINLLSERVVEWHQVRHPTFSRKYRKTPAHLMVRSISQRGRGALGMVAEQVEKLAAARTELAIEVSSRAGKVMPNCSALIGGLVAARLMSHAGGLHPLSRMPASAIQVIGARTALFAHLRTKSPSPKHGIIFQHRRVHNAPKDRRGKVARALAGKLAIAARLDYFRGEAVPEFLERAQERIDRLGTGDMS
ncbi:NOP5/NOP56 family protein [Methanoregula sp.]|uniref:NOP5/NOP56 family protein n=1 Tax=Methanoregula sp. TaxID=2052170 RepID=UPI00236D3E43|nr:NOP5/NOP56 family protein [Methanoregula sp.]MDD1687737.1 NOP58 family protein [Methanoregula sp.]